MKPDRPFTSRTMTTEQLIAEIADAEPDDLQPEVTRRWLNLLVVFRRANQRAIVEIAQLGTLTPLAHQNAVGFSEN